MRSSKVGFFVLDSWKQSGALLRSYEEFDEGMIEMQGLSKVIAIDPVAKTVEFWKVGENRSWELDLSKAEFESAEITDAPEPVSKVLTGRLLKIFLPGFGLFVFGELAN